MVIHAGYITIRLCKYRKSKFSTKNVNPIFYKYWINTHLRFTPLFRCHIKESVAYLSLLKNLGTTLASITIANLCARIWSLPNSDEVCREGWLKYCIPGWVEVLNFPQSRVLLLSKSPAVRKHWRGADETHKLGGKDGRVRKKKHSTAFYPYYITQEFGLTHILIW